MSILPLVRGTFAGLLFALSVSAAGNSEPFEGVVEVTLIRIGTQAVHFQFTGKANRLRIENTTNKLDPINVLDLGTNKLTIVYPHNTT